MSNDSEKPTTNFDWNAYKPGTELVIGIDMGPPDLDIGTLSAIEPDGTIHVLGIATAQAMEESLTQSIMDAMTGRQNSGMSGTFSNVASNPSPALSYENLEAMLVKIREVVDGPIGIQPKMLPVRVLESDIALEWIPSRVYAKRKAKNASHLKRMRNKWEKRYGGHHKPTAFSIPYEGKLCIFVHPSLMGSFKEAIPAASQAVPVP